MQVKFLLNEKTRHKQKSKNSVVSAKKINTKNQAVSFKFSDKSALPDKEEIKKKIILLEQIVKTLENKVHSLREYTTSFNNLFPEKDV